MEVRMKSLMAGPHGVRSPGEVHDVSAKEAAMLVEGGYAEKLAEAPKTVAAKDGKAGKAKDEKPSPEAEALHAEIAALQADLDKAADADKPALQAALEAKQAELAAL